MTRKELQQAWETWKQVHLSTMVSKRNTVKCIDIPKYDLKGVKGKICTVRGIVIPPFGTTVIKGIANLTTHSKYLNVIGEPVTGYSEHIAMARSYRVLNLGRDKIDVCLRNHSAKQITLSKWTAVGEVAAANIIPALLALKPTGHRVGTKEATVEKRKTESLKELLDRIDITGLGEWS